MQFLDNLCGISQLEQHHHQKCVSGSCDAVASRPDNDTRLVCSRSEANTCRGCGGGFGQPGVGRGGRHVHVQVLLSLSSSILLADARCSCSCPLLLQKQQHSFIPSSYRCHTAIMHASEPSDFEVMTDTVRLMPPRTEAVHCNSGSGSANEAPC